jgi:hypothetical protein
MALAKLGCRFLAALGGSDRLRKQNAECDQRECRQNDRNMQRTPR